MPDKKKPRRRKYSWAVLGYLIIIVLQGSFLHAEPHVVPPTLENEPVFSDIPFVVTEISAADRLNADGDLYTVLLQTNTPPDKGSMAQIVRELWQNRLPRTTQFLEVQFYLPQYETREIPYAAVTISKSGITAINVQDWILEKSESNIKYGLSKEKRQKIFRKLVDIERGKIQQQSLTTLQNKYKISKDVRQAIAFEGMANGWLEK